MNISLYMDYVPITKLIKLLYYYFIPMRNNLEQLLNSLIEKGWKPYGIDKDDIEVCSYEKNRKKISIGYMNWSSPSEGDYDWLFMSLRELVSKESGLWQFCAKNRLINPDHNYVRKWTQQCRYVYDDWDEWDENHLYTNGYDYQYYIIESSLKDESELEDFLLSNIKVEGIS